MIKTETTIIGNREFIRTYSDEGRFVVRDGISYREAYDPADKNRTYTEGDYIDPHIDDIPDDAELTDEQAVEIILGGSL